MATKANHEEERGTIITRFIIVFIICLFCAVIPFYYLFNIPDKALENLKIKASTYKGQQEKIEKFDTLCAFLDRQLKEKNFGKEYVAGVADIYRFAKDEIKEKDPYKSLFIKVSDLYDNILKLVEGNESKGEIDKLTSKIEELEAEKKEMEKKIDDLKEQNLNLRLQSK